jgi:glycosyltransferase involved in cell wall biosynthesis
MDMDLLPAEIRPVFSYDIFAMQRIGGVSRYVCELHNAFCRAGIRSTVIAPVHVSALLREARRVLGIYVPDRLQIRGTTRITRAVDRLAEPGALALVAGRGRRRGVVFHRTYYSSVPPTRKYATAITVYDMIHERHPETFPPRDETSKHKRLWCERADAIIAISDYTKHELVRLLGIDPGRVTVCHLGVTRVDPEPAIADRLSASGPFFLYVGNRGGYKNFAGLVHAFSRSRAAGDGIKLIAFGGPKQTPDELRCLVEHGVSHLVSFARGDDARLAAHYATAVGLLYPSLDEGFGIPPLEAMLHGCPVVASAAGAIPEVVVDAALLFEPTVVESMSAAIDRIASDAALRSSLVSRGAARAASFTWDAAARTTLSAYAAALELAEARS